MILIKRKRTKMRFFFLLKGTATFRHGFAFSKNVKTKKRKGGNFKKNGEPKRREKGKAKMGKEEVGDGGGGRKSEE